MTAGLTLMKSVLTPLAKKILLPFGLSAGMSEADAAIEKKSSWISYSFGFTLTYYSTNNFNEEMEDIIMKIVKSLEESGLLIQGISETIKNEAKEQKGGFPPMLLGTLAASILGNALAGRGVIRASEGTIRPMKIANAAPSFKQF